MDLISFSVTGYRRFVEKSSIKLHGRLIALVGPNEAGKSSLLHAIAHLYISGFERTELPRRTGLNPRLEWNFLLDSSDKDLLVGIHDTSHIERVTVFKTNEGDRYWNFHPRRPGRDVSLRAPALTQLQSLRDHPGLARADAEESSPFSLEAYDQLTAHLQDDPDSFAPPQLDLMRSVASQLLEIEPNTDEDPEDPAENPYFPHEVGRQLNALADLEGQVAPAQQVVGVLGLRLPQIHEFGEPDRDLRSQYDLNELADDPPPALKHLAALAGINLQELRAAVLEQRFADVSTIRQKANERLLQIFSDAWNQKDVAIQLEIQNTILHVQATTADGVSTIDERSDGMRWFAALIAFAYGLSDKPIVLVDELETHLHYDAQADLIEVLASQRFASKVIFTTHSFGCLPPDLGAGVRIVEPIDQTQSRLVNGFWQRGAGFTPLLAGMGAAALSFTPARHAIIGEGAAEAILLPTLLRQATGKDDLGFQVVPGLANVASSDVPRLLSEAGHVGFLVDGDPGGDAIATKLKGNGVSADLIMVLADTNGDGLELEDLVDSQVYADAVNEELRAWNPSPDSIEPADCERPMASKNVDAWCSARGYDPPDKTAVAQHVADMSATTSVVAHSTRTAAISLFEKCELALKLRDPSS